MPASTSARFHVRCVKSTIWLQAASNLRHEPCARSLVQNYPRAGCRGQGAGHEPCARSLVQNYPRAGCRGQGAGVPATILAKSREREPLGPYRGQVGVEPNEPAPRPQASVATLSQESPPFPGQRGSGCTLSGWHAPRCGLLAEHLPPHALRELSTPCRFGDERETGGTGTNVVRPTSRGVNHFRVLTTLGA